MTDQERLRRLVAKFARLIEDAAAIQRTLSTTIESALVPLPGAGASEDCGLSIDMLDVDRLREWARLLLVHGADISHWGSVSFVAGKMQTMATGIEKAVRDIGTLRALPSPPDGWQDIGSAPKDGTPPTRD